MKSDRNIVKDMKITVKLMLLFAVAVIALILFYLISGNIQEKTRIGSDQYKQIIVAKDLTADILPPPEYIIESYITALHYISEKDSSKSDELFSKMNTLKEQFIQRHDYWDGALQNNEARQLLLIDAYKYAIQFYDVFFREIVVIKESGNNNDLPSAEARLQLAYDNHREFIDKTVTVANLMVSTVETQTATTLRDGNIKTIALLAIIFVISFTLFIVIAVSITKPLRYVTDKVKVISRGDLGVTVDKRYISRSETGQICAAVEKMAHMLNSYISEINRILNEISKKRLDITISESFEGDFKPIENSMIMIVDNLNSTMQDINLAVNEVTIGSEHLSSGAQVLSQGCTEQASAIQQLTASIEEIASQTALNARSANEASNLANDARKNAEKGNSQMNDMLKAMDEISESSGNINKIIKVIDDIAFQTNILALNAAVEAARAGQNGKGFAVVAEEVRTLAARSANAAKESTDMIEASIRRVETGTKIAGATAEALSKIVDQVENAANLVNAIAVASKEQALGIEQVNQGILQVSQVVQTNAATAEESAAASEELSSMSAQLRQTVSLFKLTKESLELRAATPIQLIPGKMTKAKITLGYSTTGKY